MPAATTPRPRTVSLRLSTVPIVIALVTLTLATATFAWLYLAARGTIAERDARAADDRHVTQLATDYAVGASTIDYREVPAWLGRLKTGTTGQLATKFDATAPQLEQILLPLQWTSTATPLSAAVVSESGGVYRVNAYLDVVSTSAQTPEGTRATVAYALTIDRGAGWRITEVGGLQNTLPTK
ncbi:hypothetical protein [Nocardia sp. AG03]|uniref:hypothetical protein n=1 Tax=Nocardia sp. AG03 TaxID=3025312 RepID=UPI002418961A|nr:hypothetical protein [Nocardia sp. AG03]